MLFLKIFYFYHFWRSLYIIHKDNIPSPVSPSEKECIILASSFPSQWLSTYISYHSSHHLLHTIPTKAIDTYDATMAPPRVKVYRNGG